MVALARDVPAGRVRDRAVDERLHVAQRVDHATAGSSARCARRRRSACSSISACSPRHPLRLIRAGLGDSVCRPTAQADWLLAHLLLDRPYREVPFALLAADEPALFDQAARARRGDLAAMRRSSARSCCPASA